MNTEALLLFFLSRMFDYEKCSGISSNCPCIRCCGEKWEKRFEGAEFDFDQYALTAVTSFVLTLISYKKWPLRHWGLWEKAGTAFKECLRRAIFIFNEHTCIFYDYLIVIWIFPMQLPFLEALTISSPFSPLMAAGEPSETSTTRARILFRLNLN